MSDIETRVPMPPPSRATVTGIFAATDFAAGDVIADRFRIVRLLGMGAMGVVYQADDTKLDVPVALKLLRPELASKPEAFDRFRHELLLARQVSSPHVVRIHDLVQHEGTWLISMDYVAGESLEDLLAREGRLSPERAIGITRQLALGLAAAHHKGVVHRDLKPANVLLNENGDALISDFGVARSMGETRLTQSGMVVGTPAYLSPEQAQAAPIDGRSDLYTLGLMLYEMLSGVLPFGNGTGSEMLVQRILKSPPSVRTEAPTTPEWIADLLAAVLQPGRDDRIGTAEELIAAIDRRAPPARHARRSRMRHLRTWVPIGLTVAAVMVTTAMVGLWWQSRATSVADSADLVVLPFDDEQVDAPTARLLQGAHAILTAELQTALDVTDVGTTRRSIAQLGLDEEAWHRNLARVFEFLPAKHWLEIDRGQDGRWVARLWSPGNATPEILGTTSGDDARLAADLGDLQVKVRRRLTGGPVTPGLAMTTLPASTLRAIGDPGADDADADGQAIEQSGRSAFALWCSARLDYLEVSGNRAALTVLARRCFDALEAAPAANAPTPAIERWTRIHAQLLLGDIDAAAAQVRGLPIGDRPPAHLLARILADSGDLEGAETLMRTTGENDPSDGRAWFQAGKFAIMHGNAQRAVDDYLVRAQVSANRQADGYLRADVANAFGIGFRRLGQLQAAVDSYRQATALHQANGNVRGQATSLHNVSSVLSTLGRFDEAKSALSDAEQLLRPLGDAKALADLRNDFGVLAEERGDFRTALDDYREALNMRMQGGDSRQIAESLLNVGFVYYQTGDFANAEIHWQQADERYRAAQDLFGMVRAQQSLGLAQAARGEFAKARASFEASLVTAEANQMGEERAIAESSLAEQDRLEGKLDSARKRATVALGMFEARANPRGIVEMQLLQATIALALRDPASARIHLDTIGESIGNREQAALRRLRLAESALLTGDRAKARVEAEAAHALAVETRSMQIGVAAALVLARAETGARATRWLDSASSSMSGFASLPMQIELATARLVLGAEGCAADYRRGAATLSRMPDYVGALAFHQAAANCAALDAGTLEQARMAAVAAHEKLMADLPEADRKPLQAWTGVVGDVP